MVTKLYFSKFVLFGCDCVGRAQNDFHHSPAMPQVILLALLVSLKKS